MLNRKLFHDVKRLGDCEVTGTDNAPLFRYKDELVIAEIKAELERRDFRPTDQEKYEKWKEEFDVFTQNEGD